MKRDSAKPLMIGIAGGSGSGKTTLCRELAEILGQEATTLSCDSYYHSQCHLSPRERASVNFDHPDTIDFGLMAGHLGMLGNGESVSVPTYDFATHSRIDATQMLAPTPVLLVEGILLFVPEQIRAQLDLLVFVHADTETRLQRRLLRDTKERGRSDASVHAQWHTTVQPMHEEYVEPTRRFAQIVVNTADEARCQIDVVAMLASGISRIR